MATKQQIAAKIQADIAAITTPKGIKKTAVVDILSGLLDLSVPSVINGAATEIYELDGKPVFRKLLFEVDGNLLDQLDLSIPANSALLDLTSVKENVRGGWVDIKPVPRDTQASGSNTVVFKGAGNEFTLDGNVVTGADLVFTVRNLSTGQDTTFNAAYTNGADINVTLPQDAANYRLQKIVATNITGATWGSSIPITLTVVINGTSQALNLNTGNNFPVNNDIIFEWGEEIFGQPPEAYQTNTLANWSITLVYQTMNLVYKVLSMDGGFNLTGTVPFTIKFPDTTTEEITANFQGSDVVFEVQKDISGFGTNGTNFDLEFIAPEQPLELLDENNNPVLCKFISEVEGVNLANQGTMVLNGITNQVQSRSIGFVDNISDTLQNNPYAKNVFVTLLYIDLTEPTP